MNRLAITNVAIKDKTFLAYIALNDQREFVDFELYPRNHSLLNNIYIGRVMKILSNIDAAFVQVAPGISCYFPLSEGKDAIFTKKQSERKGLCEGDELIVQIVRDAVKTKKPVVSAQISISGKYHVLTSHNTALSVSKKIPKEERQKKLEHLTQLCGDHLQQGYGIISRTNSIYATEEEIAEDVRSLLLTFQTLRSAKGKGAFLLLHEEKPGYIKRLQALRDFSADAIYTDDAEVFETISRHLPYLKEQKKITFYQDSRVSLATLYNVSGNIEKLLSSRVWLSSGANIIIEQLETLTVIDVNTSKNLKLQKDGKEQHILRVNIEAAIEIARQLRLRNISGMILIDFINMSSETSMDRLILTLKNELNKDTVSCKFIDVTKLGLVELTRKKVAKSLLETIDNYSIIQ